MVSVFDYKNCRDFLKAWIKEKGGRGGASRLAAAMGISGSMISLIMKGTKNLSLEQGTELAEYLALNEREEEYLFLLIELARAGSHKLTQRLEKKQQSLLQKSRQISNRAKKDKEFTETEKSVYYSSWLFTGVRNLSACPSTRTPKSIASYLGIEMQVLQPVLEFLVAHDLVILEKGQLTYGPQHTHLASDSPYANQQHRSWRIKGMELMERRREEDLFYSCPMSLSKEAFEQIRTWLPSAIEHILKIVGPSPSEEVACFNIDFFRY